MNADDFAFDRLYRLGACIGCGFDGSDITHDNCGDEGIADLGHGTSEFDICRLQHRIGGFDERHEASCFNQSNCLLSHI